MYDAANFKLEGQVAVITGAGAGIGRAIAETFAAAGAAVMVSDLDIEAANAVAKDIEEKGGQAAANHLIRNIAFDLGPKNIRINGIAPGATRTAALESVLNDDIKKKMLAHTPINRLGEPQDMANAALFLCSPAASWISGQVLTVSGGGVQELD